jgi:hypothetical protein
MIHEALSEETDIYSRNMFTAGSPDTGEPMKRMTAQDMEDNDISSHLQDPTVDPADCLGPVPPKNSDTFYAISDPLAQDWGTTASKPTLRRH